MFVIEIVLIGVMGLLFLWLGLSLMFEKPDSSGDKSGVIPLVGMVFLSPVITLCFFGSGLFEYNHTDDQILAELIRKNSDHYHLEFESKESFRCEVYYRDGCNRLIGENAMRRQTYRAYFDDSLKVDKELLQKLVHDRLSDNKLSPELDVNSLPKIPPIKFSNGKYEINYGEQQ